MNKLHKFKCNVLEALEVDRSDRGASDLVATVLLIAGFAVATIAFVSWTSNAILGKAQDVAHCISSSGTGTAGSALDECTKGEHSKAAESENTRAFNEFNSKKSGRFGN